MREVKKKKGGGEAEIQRMPDPQIDIVQCRAKIKMTKRLGGIMISRNARKNKEEEKKAVIVQTNKQKRRTGPAPILRPQTPWSLFPFYTCMSQRRD